VPPHLEHRPTSPRPPHPASGRRGGERRVPSLCGSCSDKPGNLLLFDPATVGISASHRVNDLPGGGPRTMREPLGVHGVFVNGVKVFDGKDYARLGTGPGQVLDRFLPAR
jgi:hypothetical protein